MCEAASCSCHSRSAKWHSQYPPALPVCTRRTAPPTLRQGPAELAPQGLHAKALSVCKAVHIVTLIGRTTTAVLRLRRPNVAARTLHFNAEEGREVQLRCGASHKEFLQWMSAITRAAAMR